MSAADIEWEEWYLKKHGIEEDPVEPKDWNPEGIREVSLFNTSIGSILRWNLRVRPEWTEMYLWYAIMLCLSHTQLLQRMLRYSAASPNWPTIERSLKQIHLKPHENPKLQMVRALEIVLHTLKDSKLRVGGVHMLNQMSWIGSDTDPSQRVGPELYPCWLLLAPYILNSAVDSTLVERVRNTALDPARGVEDMFLWTVMAQVMKFEQIYQPRALLDFGIGMELHRLRCWPYGSVNNREARLAIKEDMMILARGLLLFPAETVEVIRQYAAAEDIN